MLQDGVSRRCACEKLSTRGRGIEPFWGATKSALIFFISRDACSECIAKLFRACDHGYYTIIPRYVANRVWHRCACVKQSSGGGVSRHFGGVLTSLKKYRAI